MAQDRKDTVEHTSFATPDFQMVTQALAPGGASMRSLLNATSAALAVLVVAGIGWYLWRARSAEMAPAYAARFASPVATPVLPPLPLPGTGWENAGPAGAFNFAQSVSDPLVAYTCNVSHASDQQALIPVTLGVSRDAGANWNVLATPAHGASCELSVNPTDSRDIFLSAEGCSHCASPNTRLYRTRDGGRSWQEWTLPPLPGVKLQPLWNYTDHWVGNTFFLSAYSLSTQTWPYIVVSRQGAAFTWADRGYLANTPADVSVSAYYAFGTSLYMQLSSYSSCDPCQHTWRTDDEGRSWHAADVLGGNGAPFLIGDTSDGTTLLGHTGEGPGHQHPWQSQDGGRTWQSLPSFPAGTIYDFPFDERGGVLYEGLQFADSHIGIYALTVNDRHWRLIGAGPKRPVAAAWVMWNQQGAALSLWGLTGGTSQPPHIFLQRYALGG
jgi:hypothetical protein